MKYMDALLFAKPYVLSVGYPLSMSAGQKTF